VNVRGLWDVGSSLGQAGHRLRQRRQQLVHLLLLSCSRAWLASHTRGAAIHGLLCSWQQQRSQQPLQRLRKMATGGGGRCGWSGDDGEGLLRLNDCPSPGLHKTSHSPTQGAIVMTPQSQTLCSPATCCRWRHHAGAPCCSSRWGQVQLGPAQGCLARAERSSCVLSCVQFACAASGHFVELDGLTTLVPATVLALCVMRVQASQLDFFKAPQLQLQNQKGFSLVLCRVARASGLNNNNNSYTAEPI
jgi:hypothetical protein